MIRKKSAKLTRSAFESRLKKVKMLLLDVDGVLTDGSVFYVKGQGWTRFYNIHDGYGIRLMIKKGFKIGIISGGSSEELQERIKLLGIEHAVLGSEDKLASMKIISEKTGISIREMAFMGDELFDIPALLVAGVAITVPTCAPEVKAIAHWVTDREGGRGAVREVIDVIRRVQKLN
jgi:3-deoxy-D-manno-octulosonate 8-phosphate phosphatase (KDO 8-P phosphatase)